MGQLIFYGGIAILALAVILTIATAVTASGAKKKIQDRMKEKY